jgi:uncharacterized membrane protein
MDLLTHLHPAVVHFPIALLILGSAVALAHLYRLAGAQPRIDLRRTAWFLIGLGWLAMIPAVLSGLLAQSPLPPDAPYRTVLNWHTATGLAVLVLYGLILYRAWIFQGAKARAGRRKAAQGKPAPTAPVAAAASVSAPGEGVVDLLDNPPARTWLTLALVAGVLLIVATGWNGGVLVYEWGVNVGA